MSIPISKNFYDISVIPNNWTEKRLKNILSISENKSSNFNNEKILSLTKKGIVINDISSNKGQIAQSYEKYIKVKKGQICMNPMDLLSGWVDISNFEGLISPAYYTFELNEEVENKFINYFLQSNYLRKTFFKLGKGVASHDNFGRWVLTPEELKNICVFIPNIEEQKLISNYLDNETENIDNLIDKIQKKIELLKEQRSSLINECITKGLKSNVKMRDSGMESIKLIPIHWIKTKIKYVADIFGRIGYRGYTVEDIVDEADGVITISPGNIFEEKFSIENSTYLSWEKYFESPEIQIFTNDIVIVKTGSTIGKSSIIPENVPEMTINPQLIVLKNLKVNPKFLYYQTLCKFFKDFFYAEQTGSSTPTISQEKIKDFNILKPSTQEQKEIVSFLDKQTKLIDNILFKEKKRIELLKEYRQSLISNVVTGKIKVLENTI